MSTPFYRIVAMRHVQEEAGKNGVRAGADLAAALSVPFNIAHALLLPFCSRTVKPIEILTPLV